MAVTVGDLVAQSGLPLRRLVGGGGVDGPDESAISWVHSSDLPDPTPFLAPGHLLLTTGTQLRADVTADAYVARLVGAGLVGLGFGTGLTWPEPPPALVAACEHHGLALLEVPYEVPFIAVSRWVVDALTAQAHARDDWSVRAQRTISLAALSARRRTGVLEELARQLHGQVLVFDTRGRLVERHGTAVVDEVDEADITRDARALIRRNARAGGATTGPTATVTLQTLGRRDHLRGVLATVTEQPIDAAANAVIVAAVALTELAMEDVVRQQAQQASIDAQLLRLLLEGEQLAVERILAGSGRRLPGEPLRVVAMAAAPTVAVEGLVAGLSAPYEDVVVLVVPEPELSSVLAALPEVGVGVSPQGTYATLRTSVAAASAALRHSSPDRRVVGAGDDRPLLGLVSRAEVSEVARARLRRLLDAPEADELLHTAEVWLRHNALYDPAARELGVHRHTVKTQLLRVQELVGVDLDSFAGKAELWALLQSR